MDKNQGLGALAAREAVNRPDHYGGGDNSRDEATALRAEVERLRAERDEATTLRAEVEKWAAMGRDAERAAVVAWLRREVDDDDNAGGPLACIVALASAAIERGEHRRGGGE